MSGRLILVTGGAGHIGSHLIEGLPPGDQIISLDNYTNGLPENHIDRPDVEYRTGSTNDIFDVIPETPDVIFHLGEFSRIAPSIDDPKRVFTANAAGTLAVAEFCRERQVGKLVYGASSTKFADDGNGRYQCPYTLSKAHNVELINSYGSWYDIGYAICYFFNSFGPREKASGPFANVVAKFKQSYLDGEPLTVVKPGTQERNFTWVKDLVRGLIMTAERGQGDGYALDNQTPVSILEMAQAFHADIEFIDGDPGRSGSGSGPTRARDELGWETTVDLIPHIQEFVQAHPRRPASN